MNQPRTRDLRKVIDALEIVDAELRFQTSRLATKLKTQFEQTGEKDEYLERICKRYDEATGTLTTLRRYHEARQAEKDADLNRPTNGFNDDVNNGGIATAYTGEDE